MTQISVFYWTDCRYFGSRMNFVIINSASKGLLEAFIPSKVCATKSRIHSLDVARYMILGIMGKLPKNRIA